MMAVQKVASMACLMAVWRVVEMVDRWELTADSSVASTVVHLV